MYGQTDRETDKQSKPLKKFSVFPKSGSNCREKISRLEIRDKNLIFPVPVPENGNGKIMKLTRH